MNNAVQYGVILGFLSGLWIMMMHFIGVYEPGAFGFSNIHWMEYLSVWIPFTALYIGIKKYRKTHLKNKMSFFEAIMQGLKILLIGGLLYMATLSIYLRYTGSVFKKIDYMQRISALGVVGILLVLVVSLMLMNRPRNL